ncbi:pleckstrin homology domain-containing family O member 1-like [Periophthalmus magnuspinnatus]|uniref:pleckstrin homology domain-containing family O member 1-like n=1 Tax=Periophthalmus magnuspinnatus TaxID=409849 RepID=UPI0024372A3B|nr:pleckstrin homology domain-containing family O member 1-like [Periophthalmus magnuspinnatus]
MKRSGQCRRAAQEVALAGPAPDKVGWVRQYCGRGLFRELWKNRYLVLRRERLWVCSKEVKEECRAQLVLDLSKYERCEELKKDKSRSKKSHSRFTLTRRAPNTVHSLVFLAVSPEEKESWIQVLNSAINRAKTRPKDPTLDQVALEDGALVHLTKDRVRVPLGRRLPSRGHLLAVASSSHGSLTLDLVSEEDFCSRGSWERDMHGAAGMHVPGGLHVDCRVVGGRQRAGTDVSKLRPRETRVKTGSLPRTSERNWGRGEASKALKNRSNIQVFKGQSRTPQPGKKLSSQGRNRCASMDEVLRCRPALVQSELRCPSEERPVGQLQSLIAQRMQRAQELLEEMRLQELQKTKAQQERAAHKNEPKTQNQTKTQSRFGGPTSPRVKTKDSPQTKIKKKTITDSPKTRDPNKSNLSPKDKTRDQSKSSPRTRIHSETQRLQTCSQSSAKPVQTKPSETQSPTRARPEPDPGLEKNQDGLNLDQNQGPDVYEQDQDQDQSQDSDLDQDRNPDVQDQRAEAERLLQEALCSWKQAQEVLKEVKDLQSQTLRRQRRKTYQNLRPDQDQRLGRDQGPDHSQEQNLKRDQDQNQDQRSDPRSDQRPDKRPDQDQSQQPEQNQEQNGDQDKDQEPEVIQDLTKTESKTRQSQGSYLSQSKTGSPGREVSGSPDTDS